MGKNERIVWASLVISIAGVLLVAVFLSRHGDVAPRGGGLLVWAAFSAICALGATATLFPYRCSSSVGLPVDLEESRFTELVGVRFVHGHHPRCGRFGDHELIVGGKTFCAGCTGLLIGAVSASSVATLYFVYNFRLPAVSGYIGLGCVVVGLLNIPLLRPGIPLLRTVLNALFVLGFALVLVTVDGAGVLGFDFVVIGLCVYWMFTRIQLSSWSHDRICGGCEEECDKKPV